MILHFVQDVTASEQSCRLAPADLKNLREQCTMVDISAELVAMGPGSAAAPSAAIARIEGALKRIESGCKRHEQPTTLPSGISLARNSPRASA